MMNQQQDKWGVLYCPKKSIIPQKRREKIEACLQARGIVYDLVQSESQGSVERLMTMLINNGYKVIVIIGGDSALNDAVNCLMQTGKQTRDSIRLGLVPNGLMNDFAHFWDMKEGEYDRQIAAIAEGRVRKIDLGCMRYTNKKGEKCHRYFLNCINVGLIASIMNLRRQTRHVLGSRTLSFIFSFLLLVFQRMEYKMKIRVNDSVIDRKVMTVCVGNANGYGQTPNAVPYNGMLDVSVVYHPEMTQLFEGIYLFVKGKFLNHRSVHPYRTKEIVFEQASRALVGIDGRLMNTPEGAFTVSVHPEVINFLIPS